MIYALGLLLVAAIGLFIVMRHDVAKGGKQEKTIETLEANNALLSSVPDTDADLARSLLRKAADKSKNKR